MKIYLGDLIFRLRDSGWCCDTTARRYMSEAAEAIEKLRENEMKTSKKAKRFVVESVIGVLTPLWLIMDIIDGEKDKEERTRFIHTSRGKHGAVGTKTKRP